jgi:predicted RecA/RadA family phage recombinase
MAKNRELEDGKTIKLAPTAGPNATVKSGDPVMIGQLPAVAMTDGSDTVANGGKCTVDLGGVYRLPVKGETTTNAAVAAGDILYYDAGVINKDNTNGVRFGYALDPVVSGSTTTIRVKVGY